MPIEMDETKIADLNVIMPWDKTKFMEIRAIHAADGVEYTPAQFKAEYYDTRKCADASTDLPPIKSMSEQEGKAFLSARAEAVIKGEILTADVFKAELASQDEPITTKEGLDNA